MSMSDGEYFSPQSDNPEVAPVPEVDPQDEDEDEDNMAKNNHGVKPQITVPTFNPESKNANAVAWLRSVEYCRDAAGTHTPQGGAPQPCWDDATLVGVAKIALEGKALEWMHYQTQHHPANFNTWDDFKKHFKERFHLDPTHGEKAALIAELRQNSEESALDFFDRVGNSLDAFNSLLLYFWQISASLR